MSTQIATETGLRARLPLAPAREQHFRWRGREVSRVEGFTDAVFAFAVTLLIVALEVPHTFEGLLDVVRGFPAFVICFTVLMTFWNAHYRYYRRYGTEDVFSRVLTMAILVLVLFSVYPLKFLFTLVTVQLFDLNLAHAPELDSFDQVRTLYLIYGLGFAGVWSLYAALSGRALRTADRLHLSASEKLLTRASFCEYLIHVAVCFLSITIAFLTTNPWLPGVIYAVLGPLQGFNGWWFARQVQALPASELTTE